MKWFCQHCGHIVEREGYTEICPQCWRPTMKGVADNEQRKAEDDSIGNQKTSGAISGLDKH